MWLKTATKSRFFYSLTSSTLADIIKEVAESTSAAVLLIFLPFCTFITIFTPYSYHLCSFTCIFAQINAAFDHYRFRIIDVHRHVGFE